MKKQTLTILLLLFLGSNCIGQNPVVNWGNAKIHYDTILPKQDTVRVLMLICDTGLYRSLTRLIWENDSIVRYEQAYYRASEKTWWQFGYEVREPINNMLWFNDMEISYTISGFPYVKTYLDQNKKPIQKSILVWQTKEIK